MSKNIKTASETATLLGQQAEAVCQHYLSNGNRVGNYWIIGSIHNEKGRSMYVRLSGALSGPQAVGNGQMQRQGSMATYWTLFVCKAIIIY